MLWRIRTCAQITSYSKITYFNKMEAFGVRQIVGRVGLSQHLHGTTQSFCFNQMSGQFKLISVLLYSLIWITSLGNCQTWEGCAERVIMDNCFKSSTDRQWRCFCLHEYPSATWHAAHSACTSTYQGALATDDSPYIHDILQRLCEYTRQEEAWIGARTRPLYWNWMATQENQFARPISYQGCYGVPSGVDEENHEISKDNLRGQCQTFCAAKNYSYFALEKEERWQRWPPWWVYFWFCSCGQHINSGTVDQSCEECDTSNEDYGWCGVKGGSKAVYSIHALGLFNKWGGDEPKGVHNVDCLLYHTYSEEWISQPCNLPYDRGLCVREKDGPYCKEYEYMGLLSGKCFRVQQGVRVTQKAAAEACQNRGMSLVSASNYRIHKDALDIWMQTGKFYLSFWTSGTTLRWVWITEEKEVGVNGQCVGWADKEDFAFENMCLALNSSGIWSSQRCSEYKAYICETVVDDQEVIPHKTTTLSVAITESRPPVQETTASRDATETTRETTVSTREKKASTKETGTTGSQGGQGSDSGRQVALTAGATVVGIICLLVLLVLAFAIFFIRRKRNVQKTTSEQPSTFVHNRFQQNNLRSNGAVPSNVETKGTEATTNQPKETDVHAYDYIHAESQAQICQQDIDSVAKANGDYSELSHTRPSHDYMALKTNCNKEGKAHETTEYIQLNNDRFQHEYAALNAQQNKLNRDKIQTEYGGLHTNRNSLYQK